MMRPQLRAFMFGSAARMAWKAAERLIAITASHFSGGNSSTGATCWMPALFTRMSTLPSSRAACATIAGDLGRLGHVGGAVGRAYLVFGLELGEQLVDQRLVAESIQHDVRTGRRERARDAEADAARRARHQRDFVGEVHHQRALLERFITRRSVWLALWRVVTEASEFGWDFGE